MIVTLPDTTTRDVSTALLEARENYSLATGRVLTLLVAAHAEDDVDSILETVRNATMEHPARVLVLLLDCQSEQTWMDAEVIVAADAGASEMVVMTLHGELTQHLDAVVTPLLLPDTPIVAWWPTTVPDVPAEAELGNIAHRRITSAWRTMGAECIEQLAKAYVPGDSDMMWSKITPWRGVVASAFDRYKQQPRGILLSGITEHPSVQIAASWLDACFGVEVTVQNVAGADAIPGSPIQHLSLDCEQGSVQVQIVDEHTVRVSVPGYPDAFVALSARSDAECLAEELRHLDPDAMYARALLHNLP